MKANLFLTIPNLHLPSFTIKDLELLLKTAKKFNVDRVRFTPGSQISLSGIKKTDVPEIASLLKDCMKALPGNGINSILCCPGKMGCRHGLRDTAAMVKRIEGLKLPGPMPAKIKIAVAGCKRCCTMPFIRDIGLAPMDSGWRLIFGGNGSGKPRIGDIIAKNLSDSEAIELIHTCLIVYQKHAEPKMRTSRFIEKIGLKSFMEKIFNKNRETD